MKPLAHTQSDSTIRQLDQEELTHVAGGVAKDETDPGHGVEHHLPGPGPDASQRGHISGAGL
jgi:hypothetical protein